MTGTEPRLETKETSTVRVVQVTPQGRAGMDDLVAREYPLTIILDGQELVTLLCTPARLDYLAVGFLAAEGLVRSRDDIAGVLVDENRGVVRVDTSGSSKQDSQLIFKRFIGSGCGKGIAFHSAQGAADYVKVESRAAVAAATLSALAAEFQRHSTAFRETGGVHSAALYDGESMLVFAEDIGRHNAVDKVFGECIMKGVSTVDRIMVTSGRMSSEILLKVARRGVPFLISRSAPTDQAVAVAKDLGITLVGFVRGKRMNIYSEEWRVTT